MAMQQAEWNAKVGTPCEFFLLNPPSKREGGFRQGVDFVRIDALQGDEVQQRMELRNMLMATGPRGTTPLSLRLAELYRRVELEQAELNRAQQRVIIVIVTDGLPTSEYNGDSSQVDRTMFVDILRRLCTDLPVNIVVRLTTEEDSVIDFYGRVDDEPELALEVLDDIESEAREVCRKGNVWLTYSPLIQTIREGGTFVKLFDVIDERRLTTMEALLLAHLLVQEEGDGPPPIEPRKFCQYVEQRVTKFELAYEPLTRRMTPVVEIANLRAHVIPLTGCLPFYNSGITPRVKGAWWRHPLAYLRRRRKYEQKWVGGLDGAGQLDVLAASGMGAEGSRSRLEDIVPMPVVSGPGGAANAAAERKPASLDSAGSAAASCSPSVGEPRAAAAAGQEDGAPGADVTSDDVPDEAAVAQPIVSMTAFGWVKV